MNQSEASTLIPPIYKSTRLMPIKALETTKVLAAMDSGCSLAKFVYVDKNDFAEIKSRDQPGHIKLTCMSYPNTQIKEGITWMKHHAQLTWPDTSEAGDTLEFHVTGVGGSSFVQMIEETSGMKTKQVHEMRTIGNGVKFLMDKCELSNFLAPTVTLSEKEVESLESAPAQHLDDLEERKASFRKNAALKGHDFPDDFNPKSLFPAIACLNGSNVGMLLLDSPDCEMQLLGGSNATGGRVFMGLTRILTLFENYAEINEHAEEGMIREPSLTNPDKYFAALLDDSLREKIEADRNLIAAGSVKMFTELVIGNLVDTLIQEGILVGVVAGNTMRGSAFQRAFEHLKYLHKTWNLVKIYFIDCGESGAIGTMVDDLYS